MSVPPSFEPDDDLPPSFEPDQPLEMEVVNSSLPTYAPPVTLDLSVDLQQKLNDALTRKDPHYMAHWFREWKVRGLNKKNELRALELAGVEQLIQTYGRVYVTVQENARLPALLAHKHNLEDLTYKNQLLELSNAHKVAVIAHNLIELAASQGLTLDLYLIKLSNEISLDLKEKQDKLDLKKQRKQKRIEREHEHEDAHNQIMIRSLAKNRDLQELKQLELDIDLRHKEIDEINASNISQYLKVKKIENRETSLRILEAQREQLEKRLRQADTGEDA